SSTASTTLKIAVFAPIPSASVSTTTAVNPRLLLSTRKASRRSAQSMSMHYILDIQKHQRHNDGARLWRTHSCVRLCLSRAETPLDVCRLPAAAFFRFLKPVKQPAGIRPSQRFQPMRLAFLLAVSSHRAPAAQPLDFFLHLTVPPVFVV